MKFTVQIQSPFKENNTVMADQHIAAGAGHSFLPQMSAMGHVDSFRDLSMIPSFRFSPSHKSYTRCSS